ncbi:MAG: hypothetical protein WKF55_06935 [Gemmatimonadaceae bacterium]
MYRFTHGAAHRALLIALIVPLAAACNKKGDSDGAYTEPAATAEPAGGVATAGTGALRVNDIEIGKGLNSDMTLKDQTGDFKVRDTIYAVVETDGASTGAKLDAKWTYKDGQPVSQSTQTISPSGGETRHEFHMQKSSAWPKGDYKVEVMLDGQSAGTKDFSIK